MKRLFWVTAALMFFGQLGLCAAQKTIWAPNGETEFVGHAIEYSTGKPVPGAWVLATYILGTGGVHEQAHCTYAEVVRANEKGEYVLPYYEGRPPQFLNAFARRYKWVVWPRDINRDEQGRRWIVTISGIVEGKLKIVGQEGPFANQQEALKASRKMQDVWLQEFKGSDDDWLREVRRITGGRTGCPSKTTHGMVGWQEAKLAEAEAMPDSEVKKEVVKELREFVEHEKWFRHLGPGIHNIEPDKTPISPRGSQK